MLCTHGFLTQQISSVQINIPHSLKMMRRSALMLISLQCSLSVHMTFYGYTNVTLLTKYLSFWGWKKDAKNVFKFLKSM